MNRQLVIIGAGQGGLTASIYARLQGWEVLVLEKRDRIGGKAALITEKGFHLDPGPSIIILTEIYDQVFKAAGRNPRDYLNFTKLQNLSRVYFEGHPTIDLPSDLDGCRTLLKDIAPQDVSGFDRLYSTLKKAAPLVNESVFAHPFTNPQDLLSPALLKFGIKFNPFRDYKTLVDSYFKSDLLRSFFYGFPSYGGQSYNSKAPGAFLIPFYMIDQGVYFPIGCVRAIPESFYKLALELGVEFKFNQTVNSIQVQGDRVTSIETNDESIPCDAVISNVDPWTLGPQKRNANTPASYSYFTAHWGIDQKVEGLDHHTLFIPKNYAQSFEELYVHRRFPTRPIIYINDVHKLDPTATPNQDQSLIFAVITAPSQEPHIDYANETPEFLRRIKSELALHKIEIPDDKVIFERIQTPDLFAQRDGNFRGSLYGGDEQFRQWGIFPPAGIDPKIPNLAYCGGAVQPGAGLPMVTLSGKFAVELLAKSLKPS